MSDSSIVIIQGTVGLYAVATRCHTCFAVTLKYTEDSSLTILRHSLLLLHSKNPCYTSHKYYQFRLTWSYVCLSVGLLQFEMSVFFCVRCAI